MCPWDDARRDLSSTRDAHGNSVVTHDSTTVAVYKVWAKNPAVVKFKLFKTFYGTALKLYIPATPGGGGGGGPMYF